MFSVLDDLRKDSSKAARLFVIFKGGVRDECIRSISAVVIDKGLWAKIHLQLLEGCQGIRREGTSFLWALFFCKSSEWGCQLSEIVDMAAEEVAKAEELSDLMYIGGRQSVYDGLEFVSDG